MTDTSLRPLTELHFRIWSEFHAMPGLRLTEDQVCRLMGGGKVEIADALQGLVEDGVLRRIGPYYVRADIDRYTA